MVVTAAAPLTVNTSRMVYLRDNAAILAPLLDALPAGWPGTLILVTNPVDPLCTWAQRRTGLERTRLLGYTLNDSLRLRTGIGRALGVAPGRVEAWTVGEHGDLAVPLWDRVTVNGERVALDDSASGRGHGVRGRLVCAPRRAGLRSAPRPGRRGWASRAWSAPAWTPTAPSCGRRR